MKGPILVGECGLAERNGEREDCIHRHSHVMRRFQPTALRPRPFFQFVCHFANARRSPILSLGMIRYETCNHSQQAPGGSPHIRVRTKSALWRENGWIGESVSKEGK